MPALSAAALRRRGCFPGGGGLGGQARPTGVTPGRAEHEATGGFAQRPPRARCAAAVPSRPPRAPGAARGPGPAPSGRPSPSAGPAADVERPGAGAERQRLRALGRPARKRPGEAGEAAHARQRGEGGRVPGAPAQGDSAGPAGH